ncbi:hypothetical protein J6590_058699 [Homalodisca vitripennis]|nr:hypothetical protein J6590_058699 [Homalodisca vitripennis]
MSETVTYSESVFAESGCNNRNTYTPHAGLLGCCTNVTALVVPHRNNAHCAVPAGDTTRMLPRLPYCDYHPAGV